ncbi:hypothetical protein SARC_17680, partial [Sphaeroforma arctica JP610]
IALKMSKKRRHKDAQRMVEEVTLQMTLQDHPYIALAYGAFTAPCGRPTSVQVRDSDVCGYRVHQHLIKPTTGTCNGYL